MNVVLFGGGFANKGAEAMVLTVQEELGRRLPGSTFTVVQGSYSISEERRAHAERIGVRVQPLSPQSRAKRAGLLVREIARRPARSGTWLRYRFGVHQAHALAEKADAVVDISGFAYGDDRGTGNAARMNALVGRTVRDGTPYVFLPQCWGPFREEAKLRTLCAEALPKVGRFYTRDKQSQVHVADLLDRSPETVPVAPDVAFLFDAASRETALDQMRASGLAPREHPVVGVAPNMRVYQRTSGEGEANTYLQTLVRLCLVCMSEYEADVALIPHEIKLSKEQASDDRMLCTIIEEAVRKDRRESSRSESREVTIAALTDVEQARHVKAYIGECDVLVGSRFHSLVAALSQAVPPVAIGWAHKYPQLLGDFGLEHFAIRYQELSEGKLLRRFRKAWKERENNREAVKERLPDVRAHAKIVFDETASVIEGQ